MTTKEKERICTKARRRMKEKDMTVMDEEPYIIHTSSMKGKQVNVSTQR
jgi:hypothetical protein